MNKAYILVVDDDKELLQVLTRTLELEGYFVYSAENGASALESVNKRQPDLILLDIMMPGMNGYQVLDEIRKSSDVPVIMFTALSEVEVLEKTLNKGADGYITKPFRTVELVARVRAMLRRTKKKQKS